MTVFLKASSSSLLLPKGEIKDSFLSPKPSDVPADHIEKIPRTRVELASAPAHHPRWETNNLSVERTPIPPDHRSGNGV